MDLVLSAMDYMTQAMEASNDSLWKLCEFLDSRQGPPRRRRIRQKKTEFSDSR